MRAPAWDQTLCRFWMDHEPVSNWGIRSEVTVSVRAGLFLHLRAMRWEEHACQAVPPPVSGAGMLSALRRGNQNQSWRPCWTLDSDCNQARATPPEFGPLPLVHDLLSENSRGLVMESAAFMAPPPESWIISFHTLIWKSNPKTFTS